MQKKDRRSWGVKTGKRLLLLLAAALLLAAGRACALELSADTVTPFAENRITVRCESAGTLTVTPSLADFPFRSAAENLPVEAGTAVISWNGLSWLGEPLPPGIVTLKAVLSLPSGGVSEASVRVRVGNPLCAAVSCLPSADVFCPARGSLRIECGLSRKGSVKLEIASAAEPGKVLRTLTGKARDTVPVQLKWDGKDQKRRPLPAGEYLLTAVTSACPAYRVTSSVILADEPVSLPDVFVTGEIIPSDPEDDEAVWAALTAPSVVGAGTEGQGLYLMKKKKYAPGGSISARTVAVRVMDLEENGWCRVAVWRQAVGEYMEGWVQRDKLTVIAPRLHYGALINKKRQTMTVYQDGKRLGTLRISTGLLSSENPLAATPPGVYLIGSRMKDFQNSGFHYDYPIRLHGDYLLHTVGYQTRDNARVYAVELANLGSPASHGCIRMDVRPAEDGSGLSAWWVWTRLGRDTRVIVTDGE